MLFTGSCDKRVLPYYISIHTAGQRYILYEQYGILIGNNDDLLCYNYVFNVCNSSITQ